MAIIGYDGLANFVITNYPKGSRIVEVGIGSHPEVAEILAGDFEVICTDIHDTGPDVAGLKYVKDDIFKPDHKIYRGASLIYSIRPPVDMQDSIAAIASLVGADLIIRPFSSEKSDLKRYFKNFRVVNHKGATFFLYKK
jgi:hypothetical protein